MKKSLCLFICFILAVMTLVGCSNTTADKDKVNVGNSDTKVADNAEVSAEKDKSSKKYNLSFEKTEFSVRNPYISDGVFVVNFEDKTYNFSDLGGKLISKDNYLDVVAGFSEGYAFVVDKDKKGYYIDNKAK